MVEAIGLEAALSRIAALAATWCAGGGRAGVQVWVWEGKGKVVRHIVAQDRHVYVWRLARKLEGDLRPCREGSAGWMWR